MHVTALLTSRRLESWSKGHVQWFPLQVLDTDDAAGAGGAAAVALAGAAESLLDEDGDAPAASVADRAGPEDEPEVRLSVL